MGQLTKGNAPGLTVGGRVFTDLKNLIVLRSSAGAGGNLYGTLSLLNATSGYQVPAGKTLRIWAVRAVVSTIGQGVNIGYGDNDKGPNSAAAPTNPVWASGTASIVGGRCATQYGIIEFPTNFTVPTGKYPACYADGGGTCLIEAWGYLE